MAETGTQASKGSRLPGQFLILALVAGLAACTTTVDKASVRATEGAPVSAQVEILKIPYDPSLPRYVVAIEPLRVGAEGAPGALVPTASGARYGWGLWGLGPFGAHPAPPAYAPPAAGISERVGIGIAAQLVSALGNVGNAVVLDYEHYLNNKHNLAALRGPGQFGPFVIKGAVTEFNEVAEGGTQSKGASLGWMGTVLGIAGAVAGVPGAGVAGSAISAADPTYQDTKMRRTGSVAMDLQIVDPESGRIVGTGVAAGKFTAESAASGLSVFGVGGGESAFAASALGQATRAAVNDAVRQVVQRLSTGRPSAEPSPSRPATPAPPATPKQEPFTKLAPPALIVQSGDPTQGSGAARQRFYGDSWAVIIGINDYQHRRVPKLLYAVNDARAMEQALLAQGFRRERIFTLLDGQATKAAIERLLGDQLRVQMDANDRLLVFFAGHGKTDTLRSGEEEGYLLPIDGDPSHLFSTAISMTALRQISDRLSAKHILYVVDACYSGYALFNRAISDDLLEEMVKKPAIQILTAGRQQDQAQERGGQGVFTEVLVRGLQGEAFAGKGWLALEELGLWVKQRVFAESNKKQLPQYGNLSGEGQFVFMRPLGSVAISAKLPGVGIWLGDQKIGETAVGQLALLVDVPAGRYRVKARKEGYVQWEREIEVMTGGRTDVVVDIEPLRPS